MATAIPRGVRVATESSFASVDTATGVPSISGLSFARLECERAEVVPIGDPLMVERTDTRTDYYDLPPEPVTMWASGARIRNRRGQITLRCPLRTIGSAVNYATYAAMPLYRLLASSMTGYTPSDASDTVSGAVSTTRFTPTSLIPYEAGGLFKIDRNGRVEWSAVSDPRSTANVIHSPALSAGIANGQAVRLAQTLFVKASKAPGSSVCLALDGNNWQSYAFGCRLQSLKISYPPAGAVLELTMSCAYITDASASGIVAQEPVRANGARAHFLGSYAVISGAIGTTSPAELARTSVGVDEFSFSIDFGLSPVGHSSSIVGMADMEVTSASASLDLTLSEPVTALDDDFYAGTQRSVLLGFGPVGAGNGAALYLPAATQQLDPSRRDVGERVRQRLSYRAGYFGNDVEGGADAGAPWDSPIRIGLSL